MIMLTVATAAVDSGGDGVAILGPTRLPAVPQLLSPLREDHAAAATCVRELRRVSRRVAAPGPAP